MKFWVILFSLFLSIHVSAQQRCVDLFSTLTPQESYLSKTIEVLHSVETDRFVIYREHSELTLKEYLKLLEERQTAQIESLSHISYPHLDLSVISNYKTLLLRGLEQNRLLLNELNKDNDLNSLKILDISHEKNSYPELSQAVLLMSIRINPILAEFLAVVRFPGILMTETLVNEVVYNTSTPTPQMREFLDVVGHKKLDFVSQENDTMIWGEVKYLGRHKLYDHISGHDIIEKMINIKKLARLMPTPTRVVLVLTGPGRLKPEAKAVYNRNGIEVLYLTPDWN